MKTIDKYLNNEIKNKNEAQSSNEAHTIITETIHDETSPFKRKNCLNFK